MIVVDTSAVIGFIFPDERTPYCLAVAQYMEHSEAIAPDFFRIEILNVLRAQERRGRWTGADTDDHLRIVEALRLSYIPLDATWFSHASLLQLQRLHDLTSYDALYLALAIHYAAPLATTDKALAKAASDFGLYFQAPS